MENQGDHKWAIQKKSRKKYATPSHPWEKERIEEEKVFLREYGLKNKQEIWKMHSFLKGLFEQSKKVIREQTKQSEIEKEQLLHKVSSLKLLESPRVEDVLSLTLKDILGRRLQTLVFKNGLARSPRQARQFITHKHISINGKLLTIPSALLTAVQEEQLSFRPNSALANVEHPERAVIEEKKKAQEKAAKLEAAAKKKEEAAAKKTAAAKKKEETAKKETKKEESPKKKTEEKKEEPEKKEEEISDKKTTEASEGDKK